MAWLFTDSLKCPVLDIRRLFCSAASPVDCRYFKQKNWTQVLVKFIMLWRTGTALWSGHFVGLEDMSLSSQVPGVPQLLNFSGVGAPLKNSYWKEVWVWVNDCSSWKTACLSGFSEQKVNWEQPNTKHFITYACYLQYLHIAHLLECFIH